jgi:hypothetical protein
MLAYVSNPYRLDLEMSSTTTTAESYTAADIFAAAEKFDSTTYGRRTSLFFNRARFIAFGSSRTAHIQFGHGNQEPSFTQCHRSIIGAEAGQFVDYTILDSEALVPDSGLCQVCARTIRFDRKSQAEATYQEICDGAAVEYFEAVHIGAPAGIEYTNKISALKAEIAQVVLDRRLFLKAQITKRNEIWHAANADLHEACK